MKKEANTTTQPPPLAELRLRSDFVDVSRKYFFLIYIKAALILLYLYYYICDI